MGLLRNPKSSLHSMLPFQQHLFSFATQITFCSIPTDTSYGAYNTTCTFLSIIMAPPLISFSFSLLYFAKLYTFLQTRFQCTFIHKSIFSCAGQSPLLSVLCPLVLSPSCLSFSIKLLYYCNHVASILCSPK